MSTTPHHTALSWFLAVILPALVWSAYVYISRMIRSFSDVMDISALAISVAIGVIGVIMLFRTPKSRAIAAMVYVVAAGSTMYWGMVASLCYMGDCP